MEVALSLPATLAEPLVGDAKRYGHRIVAHELTAELLAAGLSAETPELVVAAASPHHLTAHLVEECDRRGVPITVVATSAVERRHASALGIIDTVDAASWDLITPVDGTRVPTMPSSARAEPDVVARPARTVPRAVTATPSAPRPSDVRAAEVPGARATVVTVWGPGGAPGRTSIAIAIAAELGAAGVYAALGDADTHGASIAPALGLLDEAPGFAAACRLAGAGALTRDEFERIGQFHRGSRGGFWALTGLGRPSRWPELSGERVSGAIAAARDWVDVLVLDTAAPLEQDEQLSSDLAAPRRNAATLEALRAADHVVAVAAADPIGLARFLRTHAELLELTEAATVTVVVNKVRASAVGPGAAGQVRQTLSRFGGIDDPVLVPWDLAAFDAAILGGRSLTDAAPRSAARLAIRELVAERLVPATGAPTRSSAGRAG
jgi:MinD-like ATPase involved in chromosome partitioning or flagellar assembly